LRYVILELYPFDLMEFVGYRTQGRGLGAWFSIFFYAQVFIVRWYCRLMLFRMTVNWM
jgi:hypothetical protein